MDQLLDGVALITGAASSIGHATALAFAAHSVKKLALLDTNIDGQRKVAREITNRHPDVEVLPIEFDAAKEETIVEAVEETVRRFGRIDYAVNNAGYAGPVQPTAFVTTEDFRRVVEVNVMAVWIGQTEQIKQMLKQEPLKHRTITSSNGVLKNRLVTWL